MADFQLKNQEGFRTISATIASATVIEAGDLVTLDAGGLIIKAIAASTAVAYAPTGSADGETTIEVSESNEFTLTGTADANFAVTDKGITCDLVGTTTQLIDLGAAVTNVLKVSVAETAGTVGSAASVEVRINAPLF